MTISEFKKVIRDEYDVLTQDDRVTQINTMEKPEYSALDMREDEISIDELMRMCSETPFGFKGRKAYLGNNYIAPFEIKGHWFLTVTHAVNFYRCKYACDAAKYEAGNPDSLSDIYEVVMAANKDIERDNWNAVRERFFEAIVDAKFRQNPELIRNLLREDGVFRYPEEDGGSAMGVVVTKLMLNYQAEDNKSLGKYGTHAF